MSLRLIFPKLDISVRTTSSSPFKYPSDEEIFLYNDSKFKKQLSFHKPGANVWNKETATSRTQLTRFEKVSTPYDENYTKNNKLFKQKDQQKINDAINIIKERKLEKEEQNKKGISLVSNVKIIEDKRQLFLISQSYNTMENEIKKMKEDQKEKQEVFLQSLKMLQQDADNFQQFLDTNKAARADAELKLENEIKDKKAKETIIKQLNIKMTSIRGEKQRMEELITAYIDHKQFLDKLAPKEWHDNKAKLKSLLLDNLKENIVIEGKLLKSNNSDQAVQFSEELEDFEDEFEMYFKQPSQLINIFNDLEERNLFLIQTAQETEQNLEEVKSKFQKLQHEKSIKIQQLHEQKETLKKKLDQMTQELKDMQLGGIIKASGKEQKDLAQQIIEVYQLFQIDMIQVQDIQTRPSLFILGLIEQLIEKLLKQVKTFKPERVYHYKQEIDNKGKADKRKENADRQREEEASRNRINQLKLMQPSKKKSGRLNMFRSRPIEKQVEIKQENYEDLDTEDFKYFE
ncbi:unnamed protein product [Paramecium sonneborni]|uniref:DUF4200 domain-containing protein n=1 Tax=Paramecium sonneborni TaxID=65129 RepID=A0A8S1QW50_9CILI|nr:unnamed protein product [Paramecium sonneborni]